MKKIFLFVTIFLLIPAFAWADLVCTQSQIGFVVGSKTRESSKIRFVCVGTTGTVAFNTASFDFVKGKKMYSVRAFPTPGLTVADAGDVEIINSRSYDIFRKGTNLIPTTAQVESNAYNPTTGLYWFPPFDDENGYSLKIANIAGASSFTVEISLVENNVF